MASWDEDELWDDRDEPVPRTRPPAEEPDGEEPEPPPELVPLATVLESSIYRISDRLWWFRVWNRDHHPGLCVRCDFSARIAIVALGRSAGSHWAGRDAAEEVDPSRENGLTNRTAFSLSPWTIALPVLRLIHAEEGPIGRLEPDPFVRIRDHIVWLVGVYPGALK